MKNKTKDITVVDAFDSQLKELFIVENPKLARQDNRKVFASPAFKKFSKTKQNHFNFVYYPWLHTLVKCIREKDYFTLKTNRNRDLITSDLQKKLYNYKVAVFGLSVGSNIAFAMSLSGMAKKMILSDLDELETTNLNRILTGVHEIGLNKTIITARKIYEDNPYADLTLFTDGVKLNKLKALLKKREIDCIVEEIDNLPLKIEIRKLARDFCVPVVMITDNGDGVVLHVERYDLGYEKIFEEDIAYWRKKFKKRLSKKEVGETIMEIAGGIERIDYNMLQSVENVFKGELVSWSQLGTTAMLGGVIATVAIKNIVSGKDKRPYVRSYINL